ncbi:hypothetical protein ACJROX_10645 [Pseudalkalibacillus sp. A8]|uniref:hypothetical protein n=1 Tax=Pseudalkalibacillus sp. A8 TaxID=3382641 RepID=UPI0038B46461
MKGVKTGEYRQSRGRLKSGRLFYKMGMNLFLPDIYSGTHYNIWYLWTLQGIRSVIRVKGSRFSMFFS